MKQLEHDLKLEERVICPLSLSDDFLVSLRLVTTVGLCMGVIRYLMVVGKFLMGSFSTTLVNFCNKEAARALNRIAVLQPVPDHWL